MDAKNTNCATSALGSQTATDAGLSDDVAKLARDLSGNLGEFLRRIPYDELSRVAVYSLSYLGACDSRVVQKALRDCIAIWVKNNAHLFREGGAE